LKPPESLTPQRQLHFSDWFCQGQHALDSVMALFILPLTGPEPKNNFAFERWDSNQKTNFKLNKHSLAKSPLSFDDIQKSKNISSAQIDCAVGYQF